MNIVTATIAKRITDDGLCEFEDYIPLDKLYFVDLSSAQMMKGCNTVRNEKWERKMIVDIQTGEWIPLELLHLEI